MANMAPTEIHCSIMYFDGVYKYDANHESIHCDNRAYSIVLFPCLPASSDVVTSAWKTEMSED